MKKFMKKAVAMMLVCTSVFCSVGKAEAASQLGSKTKWYPNDKGYVNVLSDVSTDKYDTRFFMRGTIYYKTTGKLYWHHLMSCTGRKCIF